jgi:hypothetical protein
MLTEFDVHVQLDTPNELEVLLVEVEMLTEL